MRGERLARRNCQGGNGLPSYDQKLSNAVPARRLPHANPASTSQVTAAWRDGCILHRPGGDGAMALSPSRIDQSSARNNPAPNSPAFHSQDRHSIRSVCSGPMKVTLGQAETAYPTKCPYRNFTVSVTDSGECPLRSSASMNLRTSVAPPAMPQSHVEARSSLHSPHGQ